MRKKNSLSNIVALFVLFFMTVFSMPLRAQGPFISEVMVMSFDQFNVSAISKLNSMKSQGYKTLDINLNQGAGSGAGYVTLICKTSDNPADAITSLLIVNDKMADRSATTYTREDTVFYACPCNLSDANINKGTSGTYQRLFYTKHGNSNHERGITDLYLTDSYEGKDVVKSRMTILNLTGFMVCSINRGVSDASTYYLGVSREAHRCVVNYPDPKYNFVKYVKRGDVLNVSASQYSYECNCTGHWVSKYYNESLKVSRDSKNQFSLQVFDFDAELNVSFAESHFVEWLYVWQESGKDAINSWLKSFDSKFPSYVLLNRNVNDGAKGYVYLYYDPIITDQQPIDDIIAFVGPKSSFTVPNGYTEISTNMMGSTSRSVNLYSGGPDIFLYCHRASKSDNARKCITGLELSESPSSESVKFYGGSYSGTTYNGSQYCNLNLGNGGKKLYLNMKRNGYTVDVTTNTDSPDFSVRAEAGKPCIITLPNRMGKSSRQQIASVSVYSDDYFAIQYEILPGNRIIFNMPHQGVFINLIYKDMEDCLNLYSRAASKVGMEVVGADTHTALYTTDGGLNWQSFVPGEPVQIDKSQYMWVKGNPSDAKWSSSESNYRKFTITGNVEIKSGNVACLVPGYSNTFTVPGQYCFYKLFEGSTGLTSVPKGFLPYESLATGCYSGMFSGCSSLTGVPDLPAENVKANCYSNMFKDCSSITAGPVLPADGLATRCYYSMFNNCALLSSLDVNFTEWPSTSQASTFVWLKGNTQKGKMYCRPELPEKTGDSFVPESWTVIYKPKVTINCQKGFRVLQQPLDSKTQAVQNGDYLYPEKQYNLWIENTSGEPTQYLVTTDVGYAITTVSKTDDCLSFRIPLGMKYVTIEVGPLHVYDQKVVSPAYVRKAPSCTTGGEYYYSCKCGAFDKDASLYFKVSALGHDFSLEIADSDHLYKESTCQKKAQYYKECSRCHIHNSTAQIFEHGDFAEHLYKNIVSPSAQKSAATCTAPSEYYYTCTLCGHIGTDYAITFTNGTAKGHTKVADARIAPTCTTSGKEAGSHCSVCGYVIQAQTDIPATGHSWGDYVVVKKATETSEGLKTRTCAHDASHTESAAIPKVAHVCEYGDWETILEPACLTAGERRRFCKSDRSHFKSESIAAKGHTLVADKAVPASCTKAGKTSGEHCSVCGVVTKAQTDIPATGHSWGDYVVVKKATETSEGLKTRTCAHDASHTESAAIPKIAHVCEYGDWETILEPTCLVDGERRRYCKTNRLHFKSEAIAAKGHTLVADPAIAATCTTAGKTSGSHCSVCGVVTKSQTDIPAKGHTNVVDAGIAATCTTSGKEAGSHCSVCGVVTKAQTLIPATGHSWGDYVVVKKATETSEGLKTRTCAHDASHTESVTIPTIAHVCEYGDWETSLEPTCITDGERRRYCKTNRTHFKSEVIAAKGHTNVADAGVAPTCTTSGKEAGSHCSVCGVVTKAQTYIPAKGHTNVADAGVAATCTTSGKEAGSHCSVCGVVTKVQTDIPATGHSWGDYVVVKKATETSEGLKTRTCAHDASHTESAAIPKLAHVCEYGDWEVFKASTCTSMGERRRYCKTDRTHFVSEEMAIIGHSIVVDQAEEPLVGKPGKTEGMHCSVCHLILVPQTEIPALEPENPEDPENPENPEDPENPETPENPNTAIVVVPMGDHNGDLADERTVLAYPNPARALESFVVELDNFSASEIAKSRMIVSDIKGNVVSVISELTETNSVSLPSGTYICTVETIGLPRLSVRVIVVR